MNKHGYKNRCPKWLFFIKCPVCKTPWPNKDETITEKYLDSIGYYEKYEDIYFSKNSSLLNIYGEWRGGYIKLPKGMSGEELLLIAKLLKPKYDALTKNKSEEEVLRRGALAE